MKANISALGLAAAVGLAACGGGLLAVLQIVTPLGGAWKTEDGQPLTTLQFETPLPETLVFSPKTDVTASVRSAEGVCGAAADDTTPLVGTLDNGDVVLRRVEANAPVCIQGSFSDLRRLDTIPLDGKRAISYFNDRVDIQLQIGLWVSEDGSLSLKFDELEGDDNPTSVSNDSTTTVTGCNASNQAATVKFEGVMQGFNETTLRRPYFEKLTGAGGVPTYFTQVEFVDGATLRLINPQGQLVTLKRQPSPITCPP